MGRISHQVFSGSPTQFHWWSRSNPKPRIERLSECGLDCVDEVHCVRDAVEGQSSCTVIHKHSYSPADGLTERSVLCYCVEWVTGGRADQIQDWSLYPNTHSWPIPSCWCSYMTLIYAHHYLHSTPAPSNSVHSHSLYTTPDDNQICLDDQDTTDLCSVSNLCCSHTTGVYMLCSDPEWTDGNLKEIKHIRIRNYESVWSFHVSELFMFSVSVQMTRYPANHHLYHQL